METQGSGVLLGAGHIGTCAWHAPRAQAGGRQVFCINHTPSGVGAGPTLSSRWRGPS